MDKKHIVSHLHEISEDLMKPETMHIGFFKLGILIANLENQIIECDDNDPC